MKIVQNLCLCVLAAGVLTGCVLTSRYTDLFIEGNYNLLTSEFEAGGKKYSSLNSVDVYRICSAYQMLRQFNKFKECSTHLNTQIDSHSTIAGSPNDIDNPNSAYYKVSFTTVPKSFAVFLDMEHNLMLGNYQEMITLGERALELSAFAGNLPNSYDAIVYNSNLAIAHAALGNLKKANDYIDRAINVDDLNFFYRSAYKYTISFNAVALSMLNRHADAITLLNELGLETPYAIGNFFMQSSKADIDFAYARAYMGLKDWSNANKHLDEFFSFPHAEDKGPAYWMALHMQGQVSAEQGNLKVAFESFIKAIEKIESQRSTINSDASKIGFVGDKQAVYNDLVSVMVKEGRHAEAFEYAERGKARALVDMLAQRKNFGPATSPALLTELDELERQSLILASANDNRSSTRKSTFGNIKDQLMGVSPELASLVSVNAIKTKDIQGNLNKDEIALEYYGSGDDLYAFVLTHNSIKAVKLNGTGLSNDVASLRQEIQDYPSNDYKSSTKAMYNRVIKPVASLLKGSKLTIIAHGPLHYLPFAALNDGKSYMVDKFDMRFLPSASVMTFLNKKTNPTQELLAFGNPDLNDPDLDLPGAQAETKVINSSWKGAKVLLRKHASEANFKKFAPSFKYLHLASHGEFNQDDPLQSRMLLAPGDGEDGNLTVDELYTLNLNADLVTLSACETGLGDVANGDDVIGLTRGFLYAGAKSIVASLWPVSDEATAYLMEHFYKNLKSMKRDAALRQALLSTKSKYPHPIFWSAFQMTGAS